MVAQSMPKNKNHTFLVDQITLVKYSEVALSFMSVNIRDIYWGGAES